MTAWLRYRLLRLAEAVQWRDDCREAVALTDAATEELALTASIAESEYRASIRLALQG